LVDLAAPEGTAEAYVARPGGHGTHPGVLLFVDAFGLRPQIEMMSDRIAGWGYVVMAPNIFYRSGRAADLVPTVDLRDPAVRRTIFAHLRPRMSLLTAQAMDADTSAYLEALTGLEGVAPGGVGVTGYCMGARLSTRAAGTHGDVVAAAGGFHGGKLVTADPDSPHLTLAGARAEFVFGHADKDASMTPKDVATLGRTLAEHGLVASNEIYRGSPHGYTMADTSSYDETGAQRHFTELRALLDRTLGS
jgi:carboxymethylenebutenolidase